MRTELGRWVTLPEFYKLKLGKNSTNLNRYISVGINIDEKRFVIFEHTINHLSYPNLDTFFSFLFFLRCFFLFLPELSTFKSLIAQYSNFERL